MHERAVFSFGEFKSRKCSIISFSRDYTSQGQKKQKALKNQGFSWLYLFYSPFWVEATGLAPLTDAPQWTIINRPVLPQSFCVPATQGKTTFLPKSSSHPQVPPYWRKQKNNGQPIGLPLFLVEATGLEPTTFWSLTKRATKLRYASICLRRELFRPTALL